MLHSSKILLFVTILVGNGLLLTPHGSIPRVIGTLILILLPGLAWTKPILPPNGITNWIVSFGLSYALAIILGLSLLYLPGAIPLWSELVALNLLTLVPLTFKRLNTPPIPTIQHPEVQSMVFIGILLLAAFFRFINLGYSEFQGDEIKAMIPAAEILEGVEDNQDTFFFTRTKGPGEILLPLVFWRLTGTINESIARFPFALASILMVITTYVLGCKLLNKRAALFAAGILALNGFMVAFSRVVQYQTIVVWMDALALLCIWEWYKRECIYWVILSGIFVGVSLLAHYDGILIVPVIVYIILSKYYKQEISSPDDSEKDTTAKKQTRYFICAIVSALPALFIINFCLLVIAAPFYLPHLLGPQLEHTESYISYRLGSNFPQNNLNSFLHFNSVYSSFYYIVITGLLVLGVLAWAVPSAPGLRRIPGSRFWGPGVVVISILGPMMSFDILRISSDLDLAILPFALIFLWVLLSSTFSTGQRVIALWLAVSFLFYNFVVAIPAAHVYTIVTAWSLVAGFAAAGIWEFQISSNSFPATHYSLLLKICLVLPVGLFSGYLYLVYLYQDVEFIQDWPESQANQIYWSPYNTLPGQALVGFVHRVEWKTIGALYINGQLQGEYASNERFIPIWYTQQAPRLNPSIKDVCGTAEYYFMADTPGRPTHIDSNLIKNTYTPIGQVTSPASKGITIYQLNPPTDRLGDLNIKTLNQTFDRTATPDVFAFPKQRMYYPVNANLSQAVLLVGYHIDRYEAYPDSQIVVTLYWQPQTSIPVELHTFVHIEEDPGNGEVHIWGQSNGSPVCPTSKWPLEQIVTDRHVVPIKPDTPPGDYSVLVGMYLPDNGLRLEVLNEADEPVSNFVKLTTVSIQ